MKQDDALTLLFIDNDDLVYEWIGWRLPQSSPDHIVILYDDGGYQIVFAGSVPKYGVFLLLW